MMYNNVDIVRYILQPVVCRKCCLLWYQGNEEDPVATAAENERQLKKGPSKCIIEAPKAHDYYHIEYNLLPDSKPIKIDLVMFGLVAKVYMDNKTKVINQICYYFRAF